MSISLLERHDAAREAPLRQSHLSLVGTQVEARSSAADTKVVVLGRSIQARKIAGWLGAAGYDVRERVHANDEQASAAEVGGEGTAVIVDLSSTDGAGHLAVGGAGAVIALVPDSQPDDVARLSGYDDFILPSVAADEAVLRVERAVAHRRGHPARDGARDVGDIIEVGDVRIDAGRYRAWIAGEPVELTHKEFELLLFLARRSGRVVTREELLRRVWGFEVFVGARTVDVHVRRLRQKIDDSTHGLIETVRRVGYRLREAPARAEAGIA